ncbi:MAG: cyclase family protein [Pseudomonadales bacterium]|jgi:kynurenine formamidase|nr:cyclase family protein [Pseudomonadales bacterium]MDP6469572.1 cyclase family protein [Pseudomonadales bacterium]MDP6827413.1 cyclase family protein [Pseudomonadales bacterium]MDP6971236.1 cyclase family protein [Pseudomonadales bacterium]|tara:strand:+ start:906 stop:1853 length:948 start_codon:yes stop_codon:yes gene_type:complete
MNPSIRASVLLCTLVYVLAASPTFAQECTPSRWGPDDQIGNANLITAESVLRASKLIKTGKAYSLGITIDRSTPAFAPRVLNLYVVQPNQQESARPSAGMTYNDDIFEGWLGIGPQIDGLGHLGHDGEYYNCNNARDFAQMTGLTKLGIENVPPIVARGIVLDMAGHYGVDHLAGGQAFTVEDVKAVEKKQGTPIREGDVVLFHTGWTDAKLVSDPDTWVSTEPGQSEAVALYVAGKGVVAVGSDTWGLDVVPPENPNRPYQGHVTYLKDNGIYIFETMNTGSLVRDDAFEFLFVLGQAKVRGAVQMIINPIAIR